jgi:hypothetical protein
MSDNNKNITTEAIQSVESTRNKSDVAKDEKISIKKGYVDSILIYEVSESELVTLENGSPNSLYLNFFIFSITTFLSFLTTLLTVDFVDKNIIQNIFVFIAVVSGFFSLFSLFQWLRGKSQFKDVIKRIKERIR